MGVASVVALGQMWQVVLTAVLAWHRPLPYDPARGKCRIPDRGLHSRRAQSTYGGLGLFRARLSLGSVLHAGEKSGRTRASLVHYDAVPL